MGLSIIVFDRVYHKTNYKIKNLRNLSKLGKPHRINISVHLGIAQIAIGPPPRTQTGTLWHLFSGKIMQMPVFIGPRCPWGPIYGSGCL